MCALIGPPFQVWRSGSHWQPSELQVGDRPKPPRGPRGRCATWPLVDEAAREGGTYPWLHQPERPRYPGRLGYIPQHQGDARSASLRLLRSGFCCRRLLASPSALLLPFPTPLSFFLFPWFPPFQSLVRNGGTATSLILSFPFPCKFFLRFKPNPHHAKLLAEHPNIEATAGILALVE